MVSVEGVRMGCTPGYVLLSSVSAVFAHALQRTLRSRLGSDGCCFSFWRDALEISGRLIHLQQQRLTFVCVGVHRCSNVGLSWNNVVIRGEIGDMCLTPVGRTWRLCGMLQGVSLHSNAWRSVASRTS